MRINVAVPEGNVTPPVLNAMLEGVTRLNEQLLKEGAPTFRESVNRVRWAPEPPGQECFDHLGIALARGKADCDDLAPWHAASLRATGEDRGAKAIVKKSGPKRWHAVVQRSNGTIDDPSREAGMGQRRGTNPVLSPMPGASSVSGVYEIERPKLALRPVRDRDGQIESWQARADLPWHWRKGTSPQDVAMASLHRSPVSSQAVVGAARGALRLGEESGLIDDYTLDGIEALADAFEGADWEELEGEYGEDHADYAGQVVGSFFGGLTKAFKKVTSSPIVNPLKLAERLPGPFGGLARMANPAAILDPKSFLREAATNPLFKTGLSFIPGVGPIASQALSMAAPALQQMVSRGGFMPPQVRQMASMMPGGMMPGMSFMPPQFRGFAPGGGGFPGFPGFPGF